MEHLHITLEEVTRTSSLLRTENQKLNGCLQDIHRCMNQLTNEWQSPAAQTIHTKFQSMLPVFQQYQDIVENYAKFLDQTVLTYQTMEGKLKANAESFQ